MFVTDLGHTVDFRLDSPAAVVALARASVRRWQLAQVVKLYPDLLPDGDDLGGSPSPERGLGHLDAYTPTCTSRLNDMTSRLPTSVINVAPILGRLLHGRRARSQMVEILGGEASSLATFTHVWGTVAAESHVPGLQGHAH